MSSIRYEFSGDLEVVSPLHVGSGKFPKKGKAGQSGASAPEVAAIVRDVNNAPYIPGSTIKGALRSIAEQLLKEKELVSALFGETKLETDGQMGSILFRGATLSGDPPDCGEMPYADAPAIEVDQGGLGAGVFVAARAKIDRAKGVADDHKLFFQ